MKKDKILKLEKKFLNLFQSRFKLFVITIFTILVLIMLPSIKIESKVQEFVIENGVLYDYKGKSETVVIPNNSGNCYCH